jgi:hypothetical protein
MRLFLTEDCVAGFALMGAGIVNAVNTPGSSHANVSTPLLLAIAMGGRKVSA